jgi:TATA-binding protein-associated factor Taf7
MAQVEADTPVPTPGATTEPPGDESDESESEGDAMEVGVGRDGEGGDVEAEMLKCRREGEIRELEETIFQKRIAVAGIVNPIVRGRMLEGLGRLESELMLKKRQLEEDEEEG